jgi:hypothetical protein
MGNSHKNHLSGTSSSIRTKLWWNSRWMVLFQNCVRQSCSATKMAATVQLRCYWKQLCSRWAITGSWEPLVFFIIKDVHDWLHRTCYHANEHYKDNLREYNFWVNLLQIIVNMCCSFIYSLIMCIVSSIYSVQKSKTSTLNKYTVVLTHNLAISLNTRWHCRQTL